MVVFIGNGFKVEDGCSAHFWKPGFVWQHTAPLFRYNEIIVLIITRKTICYITQVMQKIAAPYI